MSRKAALSEIDQAKRQFKREGKDVCTDFIIVDGETDKFDEVIRILDNDPIRKLLNRGTITPEQFKAAERLYSDWYIGGMSPRLVKAFKPREIDEGQTVEFDSSTQMDAKKRYFEAYDYIQSKKIKDVIEAIVINTKSVKIVANFNFPNNDTAQSQGKIIDRLQIGLDLLIEKYKL